MPGKRPVAAEGTAISAQEMYTLEEVRRRLGIGSDAMRMHRRRGLPVRQIGNRRVVLGDELIAWVRDDRRRSRDTGPENGE